MKKTFRANEIRLIVGLLLTGLFFVIYAGKDPKNDIAGNGKEIEKKLRLYYRRLTIRRILLIFRIRTEAPIEADGRIYRRIRLMRLIRLLVLRLK